jgi:uncharacterized lipoprotein YajG
MKLTKFVPLILAASVAGCSMFRHSQPTAAQPAAGQPAPVKTTVKSAPIVTLDSSLSAKVVSYNQAGRFVVLSFPSGQMPKLEQALFLYRNGLKTAELKVTGPQSDNNIVADVVSGDAQVGDDVRDQ